MAISVETLRNYLENTELNILEQLMLDYLEAYYDKELFVKFTGVEGAEVAFDQRYTFEDPLRKVGITSVGRKNIMFQQMVEIYDLVGWEVFSRTNPTGNQIVFRPKES